jgi:putative pyruvate formate lyase activating enzyme
VDRTRERGYCGATADPAIASVTIHTGEEPPISGEREHNASEPPKSGIVNIFFAHCNLHCIFCQNYQISGSHPTQPLSHSETQPLSHSVPHLLARSNGLLGFVTAAHYAHLIPQILDALHAQGLHPTVVYNSSGYESVDTLRALEGLVDIYLPDLKYLDPDLASRYSHAPDYPEVATAAIREMQRQVGTSLKVDDDGIAYRGLIVRHLVLPGHTQNTLDCLDWLADTFMAPSLHVSLMSQYYPPRPDLPAPIDRTLNADEYALAAQRFQDLGFDGWLQAPDANTNYRPDFSNETTPFK